MKLYKIIVFLLLLPSIYSQGFNISVAPMCSNFLKMEFNKIVSNRFDVGLFYAPFMRAAPYDSWPEPVYFSNSTIQPHYLGWSIKYKSPEFAPIENLTNSNKKPKTSILYIGGSQGIMYSPEYTNNPRTTKLSFSIFVGQDFWSNPFALKAYPVFFYEIHLGYLPNILKYIVFENPKNSYSYFAINFGLRFQVKKNKKIVADLSSNPKKEADSVLIQTTKEMTFQEVRVANQTWMSKNLNVSEFRNGDLIYEAKTPKEWENAGSEGRPAWCYYDNDTTNGLEKGKLYNWFAVIDPRGLAPFGWHIPSEPEWEQLEASSGGKNNCGRYLKSKDFCHNCDNSIGENIFNILPTGIRLSRGQFKGENKVACFWSSSETKYSSELSKYVGWGAKANQVIHFDVSKGYGFSVRCIKDNN
jgi:uncharacterized protein (TIGR02145 family)